MNTVYKALKNEIQITRRMYSNDSMITISWIKSYKKEFKVFVENRLQEIRKTLTLKIGTTVNLLKPSGFTYTQKSN